MQSQKSNHFMSVGLSKDFLRQNNQKHVLKREKEKNEKYKSLFGKLMSKVTRPKSREKTFESTFRIFSLSLFAKLALAGI